MSVIKYRADIDGLRAISVCAVLFFHLGYLDMGYLGVDVFFVISGYLITQILFDKTVRGELSLIDFYLRRIRRILPLVLLVIMVSISLGYFLMLPDDYENLAQSVFATNFFANNILQAVTTKDYWNVVNEYKPLLHTWSLAIEEQYYVLYPFIFLGVKNYQNKKKFVITVLLVLSILSLLLYLSTTQSAERFYFIQYRMFELSIGGLVSFVKTNPNKNNRDLSRLFLFGLVTLLTLDIGKIEIQLILVVLISAVLLVLSSNLKSGKFLSNKFLVHVGKLSFSIYMWHQVIFAFYRYSYNDSVIWIESGFLLLLTYVISLVTYYYWENVFRDPKFLSPRLVVSLVVLLSIGTSIYSYWVYQRSGVLKDFPELEISYSQAQKGMHKRYCDRVYSFNDGFTTNRYRVLISGDSFARDFANVLLESAFRDSIEIEYIYQKGTEYDFQKLLEEGKDADVIVVSNAFTCPLGQEDMSKVYCVGNKTWGNGLGRLYRKRFRLDYYETTFKLDSFAVAHNYRQSECWGDKFIDLIGTIAVKNNEVPYFTYDKTYITYDGRHLTKAGAKYFAERLNEELTRLIR